MAETGTGEGTSLPGAPSANTVRRNDTERRNVMKSAPVAVTTQEADSEKAMRIASDLGQHHGAVDHGSGAQLGKMVEPLWTTVTTQSGWMELEESLPPDSCQEYA